MSDLKSCPFCGGSASHRIDGNYHVVACRDCSAETADEIKRKAIAAWNRRAALAHPAPQDQQAEAVRVKPLEWVADPDNDGDCGFFRAKIGDYVYEVGADESWWWQEDAVLQLAAITGFRTADAAKAAAQADYEARILSCLDRRAPGAPAAPEPVAYRIGLTRYDPEHWQLIHPEEMPNWIDREGVECQPLYAAPATPARDDLRADQLGHALSILAETSKREIDRLTLGLRAVVTDVSPRQCAKLVLLGYSPSEISDMTDGERRAALRDAGGPPARDDLREAAVPNALTAAQLADACMSYRHDYGLMDAEAREQMRREAADWWRCFARTLNEPTAALRDAGGTDGAPRDAQGVWRRISQDRQPLLQEGYTAVRAVSPGIWEVQGYGPATAHAGGTDGAARTRKDTRARAQVEAFREAVEKGKPFVLFWNCFAKWTADGFPAVSGVNQQTPHVYAMEMSYLDASYQDLSSWNLSAMAEYNQDDEPATISKSGGTDGN